MPLATAAPVSCPARIRRNVALTPKTTINIKCGFHIRVAYLIIVPLVRRDNPLPKFAIKRRTIPCPFIMPAWRHPGGYPLPIGALPNSVDDGVWDLQPMEIISCWPFPSLGLVIVKSRRHRLPRLFPHGDPRCDLLGNQRQDRRDDLRLLLRQLQLRQCL